MGIKLNNCDCEYVEILNEVNTEVKGYSLEKECDVCKSKREANNIILEQKEIERKEKADREDLIQAKIREIAERELGL